MRTWIAVAAVLLGSASVAAQACDYPPLVTIPTKDKITILNEPEITKATNNYFAAMDKFRSCIHAKLTAAAGTTSGDEPPTFHMITLFGRQKRALAEEQAVRNWYIQNVGQSPAAAAIAGPQQDEKKKKKD